MCQALRCWHTSSFLWFSFHTTANYILNRMYFGRLTIRTHILGYLLIVSILSLVECSDIISGVTFKHTSMRWVGKLVLRLTKGTHPFFLCSAMMYYSWQIIERTVYHAGGAWITSRHTLLWNSQMGLNGKTCPRYVIINTLMCATDKCFNYLDMCPGDVRYVWSWWGWSPPPTLHSSICWTGSPGILWSQYGRYNQVW